MEIDAFHLPHGTAGLDRIAIYEDQDVRVLVPVLTPAQLDALCVRLIEARRQLLQLPVSRIIAAIDRAARRLRATDGPERARALLALRAVTGYAPAMAVLTLDRVCLDWSADALHALVDAELGGPAAIEDFVRRPHARSRAVTAALAFHVLAGNVPGVSVTSLIRSLLLRGAVLGKTAAGEPVLAPLFARILAEEEPAIGDALAVTYWTGGDLDRENAVLRHAGLVVHYGGRDAIQSLRARAPAHVRFVEHGPRISFAAINADTLDDDALRAAARHLADAVALFDQQGCVSPQMAFVIGSAERARTFAAFTADALRLLADRLPRGRIDAAEAAAIHDARTRAEFAAIAGSDAHVWSGDALAHTVIYKGDSDFEGTCLNRTLVVKPVASAELLLQRIAPFSAYLQTAGLAGFEPPTLERLALSLADLGVSRISPIAAMPWPPPDWHHDGRGPLRELIRWLDLES